MTYNFNPDDIPKINTHLLVEILAFHQAALDAIMDEFKDENKAKRIIKRINQLQPSKKEIILEKLYESFGKTPDVE